MSINIPNGITSIGNKAFCDCYNLETIALPISLTSIGDLAFSSCSLISVNIPYNVTSIGQGSFSNCMYLERITVDSANPSYSNDLGGGLYNKDKTILIQYPIGVMRTTYPVPNSVTAIGAYAFEGCTLAHIKIPNGVTSIGNFAFASCERLKRFTIPDNVTSIGEYAFYNCTALTGVTVGDDLTGIANFMFKGCAALTRITLPEGVTSVGNSAFNGCSGIQSIAFPESIASFGTYAFTGCTSLTDVYFAGTMAQWAAVNTIGGNHEIQTVIVHYGNSAPQPLPVSDVYLDANANWLIGGTFPVTMTEPLIATVEPSAAGNKVVTWSSSDETVATVSQSGLITAVSEGKAIITVTTADGGLTDTCEVAIGFISMDEVVFEDIPEQNYTGSEIKPEVVAYFQGYPLTLNSDYTVSYADNINAGTATVTVTGIGIYAGTRTLTFEIFQPQTIAVSGITLSKATMSLLYRGTERLTVTFTPLNATNQDVTWTSSDESVATVSAAGKVTAKGTGTATITVTSEDGGFRRSCTVKVTMAWWQWLIKIMFLGWLWY